MVLVVTWWHNQYSVGLAYDDEMKELDSMAVRRYAV